MDQHKTKTDIEEKYIIAKELFGMKQTVVLIKFLFCRKYENLMKLFINPIHATGLFLYPLKTLENIWFSKLFFQQVYYGKDPEAVQYLLTSKTVIQKYGEMYTISPS